VNPTENLPTGQIMVPEQSRAARAWLGWSQEDFARRSNVAVNTVRNFERGQKPLHPNSVAAMRLAIEAAGVRLVFDKRGRAAGLIRWDADVDLSLDIPG
jgi:DNA-binding transcriptional regulator YiaG